MWVGVGVGIGVGVGVDYSKPESESESESLIFGRLRSPALKSVRKVRLHLSYVNKTQQRSPLFPNCMPMCSPCNAAQFDTRFGVSDTRRFGVAHGTFANTDFSRSASCWTLVHGSTLPSSCWISFHRFSSGFRSGGLPGVSPTLVAAAPCASPDPTIPTVWECRNSFDRPDSATSMFPTNPWSGLHGPRDLM